MGFFDAPEPLDPRIAAAMLSTDQRAQRALAKSQAGIIAALNGDPAGMVAVDEASGDATVVARRRVHVIRKGGKGRQETIDLATISSAYSDGRRVSLGGTGMAVSFHDSSSADKFQTTLNKLIIASRPRTIPVLYPNYFLEILAATRVQATPTNVARLVDRTAFITGGQGAVYCAQLRDPRALEELIKRFGRNIRVRSDADLRVVDDIVDWLWAWNPGCHDALAGQIKKWRDLCVKPGGFLVAGKDVPAWYESNDSDNTQAWRMMYAKNRR